MVMKKWDDAGKINLYYFDESGFSCIPSVPYAWQEPSQVIELPSKRSNRLNVLGFVSRTNEHFFHAVEGRVDSETVISTFDAFANYYAPIYAKNKQPCIVIIDNASVHTSHNFLAKKDDWIAQGVGLHYLPTYSPELNLIEILWRKIKYEWLSLNCYVDYQTLKKAVLDILENFGDKHRITFV